MVYGPNTHLTGNSGKRQLGCVLLACGVLVACGGGSDECLCNKNASCNSRTRCVGDSVQECHDGPCCADVWEDTQDCESAAQICLVDRHIRAECFEQSCADGVFGGDESDVDCGGSCPACPHDSICVVGSDCETGYCPNGICGFD
jgi:hypothetical protein